MSSNSLYVDGTHAVFACVPNPRSGGGFLYPLQDFTIQVWVKTCAGGVIASNQHRPEVVNGVCTQTTSYGHFSLWIDGNDSLVFEVAYHRHSPTAPASSPFQTLGGRVQARPRFADGRGGETRINDNHWHRVEATRRGYDLRLYVDGVLIAQESLEQAFRLGGWPTSPDGSLTPAPALAPEDPSAQAAPLYIGWDAGASGGHPQDNHFVGQIDEVRLYGAALSRTSAAQAANFATLPESFALQARFPFDSDTSAPRDATGRNPGCSWAFGRPTFSEPGFTPPMPKHLRLAGAEAGVRFGDSSAYQLDGDFSVQIWVRPEAGAAGPLVSRQRDDTGGWTLLAEENGAVTFALRGRSWYAVTSPPVALFDGNWHHVAAVRDGAILRLFVDGEPAGEQRFSSIEPMNMKVGSLCLGSTAYSGAYVGKSSRYSQHLPGDYDEVRLWSRALTRYENAAGMFHAADTQDSNLVSYWSFDDGTLNDKGRAKNPKYDSKGASFEDAPFDFTPVGQPYLLTQSCLLQEFAELGDGVSDLTSYRVVLSTRGGDDGARPSALRIWAQAPVILDYAGQSAEVDTNRVLEVETNGLGQFAFSLRAAPTDDMDNPLCCPGVFVSADFMTEGEHILVSPDRQFHAQLNSITAATLQSSGNGAPLLPPNQYSHAEAEAVAAAINDIMSTAAHHSVRATGSIDTSNMKAAQARDSVALQSGLPTQPLYLSRKAQVLAAHQENHLVRSHYVPALVPVERTATSAYRASSATRFDYRTRSFQPISAKEATDIAAKCVMAKGDDGSWWKSFVRGTLHVVESVVETITDAAKTLRATIVHLVDQVEHAFTVVINTVKDAADYLHGMLSSLGLAANQLLEVCRAVFAWDQYRPACDLLLTYTEQMYEALQDGLDGLNQVIDTKLLAWKNEVHAALDTFINDHALSNMTLQEGGAQSLVQPIGDVQSGYLSGLLCDNLDACSAPALTAGALPNAYTQNPANNDQFMEFVRLLKDARGLLTLSIGELAVGLRRVLDWVFNMAKSAIDGLFGAVEGALRQLWSILDAELHIPILSKLFVSKVGMKLTLRGLFCMIGAVGANLAFKVAKNDAHAVVCDAAFAAKAREGRMFYQATGELLRRCGVPFPTARLSKQAPSEDLVRGLTITSYVLSGAYTGVTLVWGVTAVMADLSTYASSCVDLGKVPKLQSPDPWVVRLGAGLVANLVAFPISCFLDMTTRAAKCDLAMCIIYAAAFFVDVVDPIGAALLSGIGGLGALATSIARLVVELQDTAHASAVDKTWISLMFVQNVLGSCTLLSQFCLQVPLATPGAQYIYLAAPAIDSVSYTGNAALNLSRLAYDVTADLLDDIR